MDHVTPGRLLSSAMISDVLGRRASWSTASANRGVQFQYEMTDTGSMNKTGRKFDSEPDRLSNQFKFRTRQNGSR